MVPRNVRASVRARALTGVIGSHFLGPRVVEGSGVVVHRKRAPLAPRALSEDATPELSKVAARFLLGEFV